MGSATHVRLSECCVSSMPYVFRCDYSNVMRQMLKMRDDHSIISYCGRIVAASHLVKSELCIL